PRFLAQWKQIAEHYRDAPATVMFELLNEPNGTLTQEIWNSVLSQALEVIRASNPNRTLIVGGAQWNTRVSLETLALPADDRNLIATFHYYDPMDVTHQGADWVAGSDQWLGTTWKADAVNVQNVKDDFAQVATWAKSEGRPILLGEFGVYSKAGQATRVAWTRVVREQAEAHGFSWAYWELASSYGLLEPYTNNWRQPLVRALMPKSPVLASRY
ncbi:MAG: glycoside hydrolase family 5 protein, partial [Burkholderiaceae bacterium]|nr:glycoside hydrolase family 5 protein [Burkholderiaceae bacterium]